ncbi:hypothetical protein Tco_0580388 [Tanacetum coccineum]
MSSNTSSRNEVYVTELKLDINIRKAGLENVTGINHVGTLREEKIITTKVKVLTFTLGFSVLRFSWAWDNFSSTKSSLRGEECLEGCVGAGGGEVNGSRDVFGVSKSLLGEILGVVIGESGGDIFGDDGGAVW